MFFECHVFLNFIVFVANLLGCSCLLGIHCSLLILFKADEQEKGDTI